MNKLNILIVENPNNLEIDLSSRLSTMGFNVKGLLSDTSKVIEFIENNEVDLVLTDDFSKSELNGVQLANDLNNNYEIPVIIMVSDENSLDYEKSYAKCILLKPMNDTELMTNVLLAHKSSKSNNFNFGSSKVNKDYLFVRADYRLIKIRMADIYYIESKKDYVNIHTKENVFRVHSTMKLMEKSLNSEFLIRIHRSYIINIDKIFSIKYPELVIEDKMKTLSIGGLYRKSLYNKINII